MWWYSDQKKNPSTAPVAAPAVPDTSGDPYAALDAALSDALRELPLLSHALLAMSLLVDHSVHFADGTELPSMTWQKAEATVARTRGPDNPSRLYNAFAQELGDGYSLRTDLPPEQSAILTQLRQALLNSSAIKSLESAS